MKQNSFKKAALALGAAGLCVGLNARGADCASLTLNVLDQGWYNATGFHDPANDNYVCGGQEGGQPPTRNWFVFNIPLLTQPVASASLRIYTFDVNTLSTETFELRQVTTPIATLRAGGSGRTAIYADLGDGPLYGSRSFPYWEDNQVISISLNAAFLASLKAAAGGSLALGGQLISLNFLNEFENELLFGGSGGGFFGTNASVQLIVNYSNASPPAIVQQPASLTLSATEAASFQVQICGGGAPTYQWQHSGTNLPGASSPFLQLLNVQPADAGPYRVLVLDALTTVASAAATLTVNASAPTGSIYICSGQSPTLAGQTVQLCSAIFGQPMPNLRWQVNGADIPGETYSYLYFPNVQTNQSGSYQLVASNVFGAITSAPISLVVTQAAPTGGIYVAGGSLPPPAGSSVILCSTISGGPTPRLQWQFNGANVTSETNACLYLWNLASNQSGSYRITASNVAGVFTSAPIAVAVNYFAPTGSISLYSGQSPAPAGSSVTLCAAISGGPYPDFQWQFNGVNLPGQINSCLGLANVSSNQAGLYRLVASNSSGAFTSAPIALAVSYFPPSGTIRLYNASSPAPAGSSVSICSEISAAPPPSYQWQFNGVNLPGQTGGCLTLNSLLSNQAGLYRVVASNVAGAFTSAPVALDVYYTPPYGSISPSGTLPPTLAGGTVVINGTFSGAPFPNFQWQFNGADLPGKHNSYLELLNAQTNQSGRYRVIASNVAGSITSAVAVVSIIHAPPTATIYLNGGHTPTIIGSSLRLCSTVFGAPVPTVQWQFNGSNLPGQTNGCLDLTNVQTNQSGGYTVVASNALGVVTSAVATITIIEPVPLLAYFANGVPPLAVGTYTYVCAEVFLPEAVVFQWQLNGSNVLGGTNACLYVPAYPAYAGDYSVVAITPTSGLVTSAPISLTLYYAPPAQAVPQFEGNQSSALAGTDVRLNATYSGSPASLQWRFQGVDLVGQTQPVLNLPAVTTNQSGEYSFTATNLGGMTTSSVATLDVIYQQPVFLTQPSSQSVVEGLTARFGVAAAAGPPPVYFLEHDGTNVAVPFTSVPACFYCPGGFSLLDTTFADAGNYRIIASNLLGTATSVVATLTVTPAGPLDRWTQRNPLPQSQPLLAVAHSTNQYVAVGERGTILTSPDGSNWALQNRRADVVFHGVAYGGGLFVVVGTEGTILSSADGTNWSYRYTGAGTFLYAVTYGNGQFVAVGTGPGFNTLVLHSTDGLSWERIPLNGYFAGQCVTYGNGRFVAAGSSIITSPDGINWEVATGANALVENVTYADGFYVAVGDNGLTLVSADGAVWTSRPPVTTRRLLGVTYGLGRFVAAGARGTMLTSTDTITWTAVTSGTPDRLEGIDFMGGRFVAAGENGTIITSTNGTSWMKENLGITRDLDGMDAADGTLVIVGKGGSIITSRDGVHYTTQNAGVPNDLHGVLWGGGLWVAVGEPGIVLTSSNAVNWISHATGTTNSLKDGTYAHGQWIVVGTQGTIVRSTDGVNWASTFTNPAYDLNDVAYGNGVFLVAGDGPSDQNGSLFQSMDGVAWTQVNFYPGKNLRGVTFANGRFLIPANDGLIFMTTTADPAYFTARQLPTGNLRAATWAHGLWIVVGNNGAISTSPDLTNWTSRASRTFENQHQVALLDGKLVVIGNRGGILQSGRFLAELEPPVFMPGLGLRLPFNGVLNHAYQVQASSDLLNWVSLATFTNTTEHAEFNDTNALQNPLRFYRLVEP